MRGGRRIITSFRYKQTWPTIIRLLKAGVFGNASQLVTHTYRLEDAKSAFEACITPTERSIKVQIVDNDT